MKFDFEIEGLDEAIAMFRNFATPGFIQGVMVTSLTKSAIPIEETAKQLCPVGDPDTDPNSGQLRNSITTNSISDGVEIGSDVEYAPYVELGTGIRGDEANVPLKNIVNPVYTLEKKHECKDENLNKTPYPYMGQAPHPYLYPALEAHKQDVKQNLISDLDSALKGR